MAMDQQEVDGGKGRMGPERDGGEGREIRQREITGKEMKAEGIHLPQTGRDVVLKEERRGSGESIEAGGMEFGMETGSERRIGIETERGIKEEREKGTEEETGRGTGTERGTEIVKETERERGPVLHHHRHHPPLGITGATILLLLVH